MPRELQGALLLQLLNFSFSAGVRLAATGWHFTFFSLSYDLMTSCFTHMPKNQVLRNNPSESFLLCADSSGCHVWSINRCLKPNTRYSCASTG